MPMRRTILTICMAVFLVASSLPLATISPVAPPRSGTSSDTPHILRCVSDPSIAYDRPLRNSQQDLRELQTTSLVPDIVSPVCSLCVERPSGLRATEDGMYRVATGGSLLSLHCRLIV